MADLQPSAPQNKQIKSSAPFNCVHKGHLYKRFRRHFGNTKESLAYEVPKLGGIFSEARLRPKGKAILNPNRVDG